MHDFAGAAPPRASVTAISFARCYDAAIFTAAAELTAVEAEQLRELLGGLEGLGLVTLPSVAPMSVPSTGLRAVMVQLSDWLAPHVVKAVAATLGQQRSPLAPPNALMPLWPFEPCGDSNDLLVTTAQLWGCDLHVEALRVESDEEPRPVPSVAARFAAWRHAAPGHGGLATVRLPGREGRYVLFASSHPA